MLKIDAGEQVMLNVRVAEVQREIAKQLGINLTAVATAAGVPIIASTSNPFGLLGRALSEASGVQIGNVGTPASPGPNNVQGILQALEQVGLVHTLAEPNLDRGFRRNGEVPRRRRIPRAVRPRRARQCVGAVQAVRRGPFLHAGRAESRTASRLQISTEVSELTNTGAFTLASGTSTSIPTADPVTTPGLTIPALVRAPRGNDRRASVRRQLRHRRALMQHTTKQHDRCVSGLDGHAGAGCAVP